MLRFECCGPSVAKPVLPGVRVCNSDNKSRKKDLNTLLKNNNTPIVALGRSH